jgi:hypothetical protein
MKKQIETANKKLKNFETSSGLADLDVDDLYDSAEKELQTIIAQTLAIGG